MSTKIQITPAEIKQIGGQFKQTSAQSREMIGKLNSVLRGAQGGWQGMSSQKFYQEFEAWKKSMDGHVVLLENIGKQLEHIARTIELADQEAAKM